MISLRHYILETVTIIYRFFLILYGSRTSVRLELQEIPVTLVCKKNDA